MKKHGGEESIELIWPLGMKKWYHTADIVQTLDLGTERRLLVEVAVYEITVFLGGNATHPVDTDATGMTDHLTNHMLCHLVLVSAYREISIAPLTPVSTVEQDKTGSSILFRKNIGKFRKIFLKFDHLRCLKIFGNMIEF